MKNFENVSKRWLVGSCVVGMLSLLFSSCLKDNKNSYYNPPVAYVTVIQALPGEPPLNFSLNNNRVNFHPLNFGDDFDYFRAFTGTRTVNFNNAGTMSQVLSDTVNLQQDKSYSVFLANTVAHPQLFVLSDSLSKPASGTAGVRFVALSPDAPAVDLVLHGGTKLASNKSFKGHTPFVPVTGNATYTLQVLQAGTSTVLATISNITLSPGVLYTVWFGGLANTTVDDQKLQASIVSNAVYY